MTRTPNQPSMDMHDEDTAIELQQVQALRSVGSSEIDTQVATAKRFPRAISTFKKRVTDMIVDQQTAIDCIYALPRGGKKIEGPSVRLAEIVVAAYGNLRAESRVVREDDRYVYAEAVTWDLEANTAIKVEVRRRITDKNGGKFNDDMIGVTSNAATSIALRNSVFKVIPRSYVNDLYATAKHMAIGDVKTLSERRGKMVDYFMKMGVTPDRICAAVEVPGIDDIGGDELAYLIGLANAIKEGEMNVDTCFPEIAKAGDLPAGKMGFGKANAKPKEEPDPATTPAAQSEPQGEPAATEEAKPEPKPEPKPATTRRRSADTMF